MRELMIMAILWWTVGAWTYEAANVYEPCRTELVNVLDGYGQVFLPLLVCSILV